MLSVFEYPGGPDVLYSPGACRTLEQTCSRWLASRTIVFIVDPSVFQTPTVKKATDSLSRMGAALTVFHDIQSDPSAESIDQAAAIIRDTKAGVVVGLGGGSTLDVAKMAAAVAAGDKPAEYYALMANPLPRRRASLLLLPSTAGSGAEITRTAVFSRRNHRKVWAWDLSLWPDQVILDPELTVSMPPAITAFSGLDAVVHAIEACTNRNTHCFVQALGLHAIRLAAAHLPSVLEKPMNLAYRGAMLQAATLAGMAIDRAGTGIAHAIGHALASLASIHHGRAVVVSLNAAYALNAVHAPENYAQVDLALGAADRHPKSESLAVHGQKLFQDLARRCGMRFSLKDEGLSPRDADKLLAAIRSDENAGILNTSAYVPNDAELGQVVVDLLSQ